MSIESVCEVAVDHWKEPGAAQWDYCQMYNYCYCSEYNRTRKRKFDPVPAKPRPPQRRLGRREDVLYLS
jgi:hypothetical protein